MIKKENKFHGAASERERKIKLFVKKFSDSSKVQNAINNLITYC